MPSYLSFEMGDSENARGRALLYLEDRHEKKHYYRLIEINGILMKENLLDEIVEGRLIAPNIFDAFYIKTSSTKQDLESFSQIKELSKKEHRDLVCQDQAHEDNQPVAVEKIMEQLTVKYSNVYRERLYLRTIREFEESLFRSRPRVAIQEYYQQIFRVAYWVCIFAKARRENDEIDISFARNSLVHLKKELPLLNLKRVGHVLEKGSSSDWLEVADYLDTFFLTIKKHYPLEVFEDKIFSVNEENGVWLKEELPSLYEKYFLALFHEEYEKANEVQEIIRSCDAWESMTGCSNS